MSTKTEQTWVSNKENQPILRFLCLAGVTLQILTQSGNWFDSAHNRRREAAFTDEGNGFTYRIKPSGTED